MTALVTGASSGIGRAIATALAADGTPVWAVGRHTGALDALTLACPSVRGTEADLVLDDDVERIVSTLAAEAAGLDVLVHSAGAAALGCVASAPVDALDDMYRLNLRAPYLLTQRLLPLLRRARGQVVFVNSSAGLHASAGMSQYAATKHALKALADSLRCEVNEDGIRVLSVYPGRTASPMQERLHSLQSQHSQHSQHKPGAYRAEDLLQPDDVAAVVVQALGLPRTAEVTDLHVRPFVKPD
jgi:NADP-dependent 3-hydroxy acid dehydrogenase YdfG